MKRIQARTAAGLLLPLVAFGFCAASATAADAADEPASPPLAQVPGKADSPTEPADEADSAAVKSVPEASAAASATAAVVTIADDGTAVQDGTAAEASGQQQRVEVRVETRTSRSADEKPQVRTQGRIVVIGKDGVKKEYDLNAPEGRALILQLDGGANALKVLEGQSATPGSAPEKPAAVLERVMIGVACQEAPPLLRKHLKLDHAGLVVLSVAADSPAAAAGVEPDDVLLSLNDRPLQTTEQLMEVVSGLEAQSARLQVIRRGDPRELSITPRKMAVPAATRSTADLEANDADVEILRLPGTNQRLRRIFPGVIIDEQFPADRQAMERMLKKLGSMAHEGGDPEGQPQPNPDSQRELKEEVRQLREQVQQLIGELRERKPQ